MSNETSAAARTSAVQRRVNKGVPTGGQFASTEHAEPTLVLTGAPNSLEDYTDPEEFVRLAMNSAEYWQHHYNQKAKSNTVDLTDIAQETMLRVLQRVKKGAVINDFKQLVSSTAANVTVRATENVFRAEDRRAYRIFEEKRIAMANALNRNLTTREQDAIAQEVLDEWHDPRHKPSKDFRIARTVDRSLEAPLGGIDSTGSNTMGDTLVSPSSTGHYVAPDSYMDQALTASETTGAANKAEMKRLAWNAFAERAGVPLVAAGTLSQRQVTKHRGVMEATEGGVMTACTDWSNGHDGPTTEALFAPFGELDLEGQEKVVSFIERSGADRAQTMWESAIAFANNKHAKAS